MDRCIFLYIYFAFVNVNYELHHNNKQKDTDTHPNVLLTQKFNFMVEKINRLLPYFENRNLPMPSFPVDLLLF